MNHIDYTTINSLLLKDPILVKIKNRINGYEWFISLKSLLIKNDKREFSVAYVVDGNLDLSLREQNSEIIAYTEKPPESNFLSILKAKSYINKPVLLLYIDGGMISGIFRETDTEIILDTNSEESLDKGLIGFLPLSECY